MKAHKYQGPIFVFLATFDHLLVFFLGNLGVHEVERP